MKFLIIFVLLTVLVSQSLARPQRFPGSGGNNRPFFPQQFPGNNQNPFFPQTNNQGNGGNNNALPSTTTTVAPNTATTASPQYLSCLQSCPSTMEYNPICGSDNINYHNNGRLACAQRCGKNVSGLRSGTCNPL